ncbi:MAG: hypothetical protein ABI652_08430 [Acidobacteriota bacterium]
MTRHRASLFAAFALLVGLATTWNHATLRAGADAAPGQPSAGAFPRRSAADTLPDKLSDEEFWKLSEDLSEPNGSFRSDNLLSNELFYPVVLPDLVQRAQSGGVYLGVGPEQNFEYIIALKPKMVFITDIRRGNMHTHLMYKALFELSADRAEFVARLFTKTRPAGLTTASTATELMNAFWDAPAGNEAAYQANLQAIFTQLTKKHTLPLSKDDLDGIEYVYHSFYWFGPSITYNSSSNGGAGGGNMTNYAALMMAADDAGVARSYLANEATFNAIKDLEIRNMIVPLVGNFGGPKALRAVGQYVRAHGATVSAFYLSNVEQYLRQDGIWDNFCGNVASMPLDGSSTFIRSGQGGFGGGGGGGALRSALGPMQSETQECAVAPAGAR